MRKDNIAKAAFQLAQRHGIDAVTRDAVAARARCSTGLVSYYFQGEALQLAAYQHAITAGDLPLVAAFLASPYRGRLEVPPTLKRDAIRHLAQK